MDDLILNCLGFLIHRVIIKGYLSGGIPLHVEQVRVDPLAEGGGNIF